MIGQQCRHLVHLLYDIVKSLDPIVDNLPIVFLIDLVKVRNQNRMKVRPIVFLDIDGVLNSYGWWARRTTMEFPYREFDPACLSRLSDLANHVDADIVISSSWRKPDTPHQSKDELIDLFADVCRYWAISASVSQRITDITPKLDAERGIEIRQYLNEQPGPREYVILDDQDDFFPDQPLVQTDSSIGLSFSDSLKALAILKAANAQS